MSHLKTWLIFLLCLGMIFSCSPVYADILDKETAYQDAVEALKGYTSDTGHYDLADIESWFREAGNYEYSLCFVLYVQTLKDVENCAFSLALSKLNKIKAQAAFSACLEEQGFPPLADIESYVTGRKAEAEGNLQAALDAYNRCLTFKDSLSRLLTLEYAANRQAYEKGCAALQQNTFNGYLNAYLAFSSLPSYGYENSLQLQQEAKEHLIVLTGRQNTTPQESAFWRYNRTAYATSAAARKGNAAVFSLLKSRNKIYREADHVLDLDKASLQEQGIFFNLSLPENADMENMLKDKTAHLRLTLSDGWSATIEYTMLSEKAALYDGNRLCFVIDDLVVKAQDHSVSLDGQSFSLVLIIEDCLFFETHGSFSDKQPEM